MRDCVNHILVKIESQLRPNKTKHYFVLLLTNILRHLSLETNVKVTNCHKKCVVYVLLKIFTNEDYNLKMF